MTSELLEYEPSEALPLVTARPVTRAHALRAMKRRYPGKPPADPAVRMGVYMEVLELTGNPSTARRYACVKQADVDAWAAADPEFAERHEQTRGAILEILEAAAFDRAVYGVEEPVWYQGEQVGAVTRPDSSLLRFLLEANDPAKYRASAAAVTVKNELRVTGVLAVPGPALTEDEWRAQLECPDPEPGAQH